MAVIPVTTAAVIAIHPMLINLIKLLWSVMLVPVNYLTQENGGQLGENRGKSWGIIRDMIQCVVHRAVFTVCFMVYYEFIF